MTVRLTRAWRIWVPGDVAGFSPDVERMLIDKGFAAPVGAAAPPADHPVEVFSVPAEQVEIVEPVAAEPRRRGRPPKVRE
jgi:hypothetical protein